MKKIMIYRKTQSGTSRDLLSRFTNVVRVHSDLILAFVLFLCGNILGSFLCRQTGEGNSIITALATAHVTEKTGYILLASSLEALSAVLIAVFGSMSAFGVLFIGCVPLAAGFMQGLTATYLLSNFAVKGLGYYCIVLLPGATLHAASLMALCALAGQTSKKVAAAIFSGENKEIVQKNDWIIFCIILLSLILSSAVNGICVSLFAGLF